MRKTEKRNKIKKDISILIWFVFIWELFLFLLAVIVGQACGYRNTFIAFGIMGALLGIPMIIVMFVKIGTDGIIDMFMKKIEKSN